MIYLSFSIYILHGCAVFNIVASRHKQSTTIHSLDQLCLNWWNKKRDEGNNDARSRYDERAHESFHHSNGNKQKTIGSNTDKNLPCSQRLNRFHCQQFVNQRDTHSFNSCMLIGLMFNSILFLFPSFHRCIPLIERIKCDGKSITDHSIKRKLCFSTVIAIKKRSQQHQASDSNGMRREYFFCLYRY